MASSSISVAVRVRPLTDKEKGQMAPAASTSSGIFGDGCLSTPPSVASLASHRGSSALRHIIKVLDQRILVFDPPEGNPLQQAQKQILARFGGGKKVKDMRFCFDRVFDDTASQEDVYEGSAKELVAGVLDGFNATVFAYGATGCGKTHTITGTPAAPGIVYLLMRDLFGRMEEKRDDMIVEVSISYLEIYNETIRDLFNPTSPPLNLREANASVSVPGLVTETPTNASDVIRLISAGNAHRTVHGTDANAVSSRSHAVLSVNVRRKPRTDGLSEDWTVATLSVIDLAGSERASVTRNKGDRLLEGANINRSLLALGNCINALCDPRKRGHVPYRDSKLTRLLKHSLGGNCRTLMIVCVAPTSAHYDETHNTLQYANRAKEIKTKATRNIVSVDRHVSQYVQVIFQLREELAQRKADDAKRLDSAKADWEKGRAEVEAAVEKARRHWEDAQEKVVPAARAKGQLRALAHAADVLSTWRAAAFNASGPQSLGSLDAEISTKASQLQSQASAGDNAKSMYGALVASLARSIETKAGASGAALFDRQVRGGPDGWGLEGLAAKLAQGAETEGDVEGKGWIMGKLAGAVGAVVLRVSRDVANADSDERRAELLASAQKVEAATRVAFEALSTVGCSPQLTHQFVLPLPPMLPTVLPAAGTKRDLNNRSPVEPLESSRPVKARRASVAANTSISSAPVRVAASPGRSSTYFAKRSSPRKQVIFPSRANGILKAKVQGTGADKKGGGVRWKDEAGEGWDLESFDETKVVSEDGDSIRSVEASLIPSPPSEGDPFTATVSNPSAPLTNPARLPRASLSGRMQPGFLGRHKAAPPARGGASLGSVGEEGEGDSLDGPPSTALSFLATDPYLRRVPFGDAANASIANSSISSVAPTPNKRLGLGLGRPTGGGGRRVSSIGPIRSAKPSRRLSLTKPRDASGPSVSSHGAGVGGPPPPLPTAGVDTPKRKTLRRVSSSAMRRASLAGAGLSASVGSGGGAGLPPRARRVSTLPGAGGAMPGSAAAAGSGAALSSRASGAPLWR